MTNKRKADIASGVFVLIIAEVCIWGACNAWGLREDPYAGLAFVVLSGLVISTAATALCLLWPDRKPLPGPENSPGWAIRQAHKEMARVKVLNEKLVADKAHKEYVRDMEGMFDPRSNTGIQA